MLAFLAFVFATRWVLFSVWCLHVRAGCPIFPSHRSHPPALRRRTEMIAVEAYGGCHQYGWGRCHSDERAHVLHTHAVYRKKEIPTTTRPFLCFLAFAASATLKDQEADHQRRIRELTATCTDASARVTELDARILDLNTDLEAAGRARRDLEDALVSGCAWPGLRGCWEDSRSVLHVDGC